MHRVIHCNCNISSKEVESFYWFFGTIKMNDSLQVEFHSEDKCNIVIRRTLLSFSSTQSILCQGQERNSSEVSTIKKTVFKNNTNILRRFEIGYL